MNITAYIKKPIHPLPAFWFPFESKNPADDFLQGLVTVKLIRFDFQKILGVGKTMLMDIFFHSTSVKGRRIHFHEFMGQFHKGILLLLPMSIANEPTIYITEFLWHKPNYKHIPRTMEIIVK